MGFFMKKIIIICLMLLVVLKSKVFGEEADLDVKSKSVVLMEKTTGDVIIEKNSEEKLSPASITKIMTLILIFDNIKSGNIKLDDIVTTSEHAKSMGGSQVFLETGEKQTVDTLIKCIIIASGNDASVAMAEYIAGTEEKFVEMMNEKAKNLKMMNTHFEDCCGLTESDDHYTTAMDVAIMSRQLISDYPQIYNYSSIWMENIIHNTDKGTKEFTLSNTNKLLKQYEWTTGLKTGSTSKAKYCVSATAKKNNIDLIAVVMCAPDYKTRFNEAEKLLEYGFSKCELYEDKLRDKFVYADVKNGKNNKVKCEYESDFHFLITDKNKTEDIKEKMEIKKNIMAPVKKGDKIGEKIYMAGDRVIGKVNIITSKSIKKMGYADIFLQLIKNIEISL